MKKMMTALMALFLMAGTSALAQESKSAMAPKERPTTEQLARKATERMTEQLKLTDKQAEQVYEATLQRLRASEALREQARSAKSEEAEKMKTILSTEQFVRWSQSQVLHDRGPRMGRVGQAKDAAHASKRDAAPRRRGDRR